MNSCCVVQFAKKPELGRVKTRMQPGLSQEQSLQLHRCLLEYTCLSLSSSSNWDYQLWFSDQPLYQGAPDPVIDSAKRGQLQQEGDLGARMAGCFEVLLSEYKQVILVGSDCPYLTERHVEQVISLGSSGNQAIVTPALDGGYVLISLCQFDSRVFENIDWGTDRVLAQTEERLKELAWRYELMPALGDVDYPEDLDDLLALSNAQDILGKSFYSDLSRRRS